jgi:DNA adenine methylase
MLIPYPGEKSSIASFITPRIPRDIGSYIEPFGGMFGVFFSLNFSKMKDIRFVYGDIDYLNYNLFLQMRDSKSFIDSVKDIKADRDRYKSALKGIIEGKREDLLAIDWLISLCCQKDGGGWNGDTEFEIFKMKFRAYKYHIDKIAEIHNWDYKKTISEYDSKESFFYLDPPEKAYLTTDFSEESHSELADILRVIEGRFILSYRNFEGLRELYSGFKIEPVKTLSSMEFLISNF